MIAISKISDSEPYARCVQTSKRVRWDVDMDVIRGRCFDTVSFFQTGFHSLMLSPPSRPMKSGL
jgi:hypothetical protein